LVEDQDKMPLATPWMLGLSLMNFSLISCLTTSLVVLCSQLEIQAAPPGKRSPYGYLWFYESDDCGGTRKRVEPYCPQEGDVLLFDSMDPLWAKFYHIAGTGPPLHAGIMIKRPDGVFAVLESGPDDKLPVYITEASERVQNFLGILQVRRCKKSLSPEESALLTQFAMSQKGKSLAALRLVLQMTPFKVRGGLTEKLFAKTWPNRWHWLCSELVVSSGTRVGLFDASVKGNVCYPLDLLDDQHKYNISATYELPGYWCRHP
jgi:hypothetical protein